MGGIGGFVSPCGGAADLGPLKFAVADKGAEFHIHIFRQNIGVVVDAQLPKLQLVPHAGNEPGVRVGIVGGDFQIVPQPVHQLRGSEAHLQQQGGGEPGRVEIVQIRGFGGGLTVSGGILCRCVIRFCRLHKLRM